MSTSSTNLHIVIIGAGLGGLTTAIACRRANPPLDVTVVERSPEILSIGAGIHIPPNACRILTEFGLLEKLKKAGGYEVEDFTLRRYADGQVLAAKPLKEIVQREHGAEWIAIHRGDYQSVLLEEAVSMGAKIMVHAEALDVQAAHDAQTTVHLKDGQILYADVVIGADGLWSQTRKVVVGHPIVPQETGDLAYRATFSRSELLALKDDAVNTLLDQSSIHVWLGPGKHAVFYPLREHTEYNLVLLVADDLPTGTRTAPGSVEEMTRNFDGWDNTLRNIMSRSSAAPLKWKLLHLQELEQWTRDTIALIGDASHPSLPYLGQGAAMAVEDGATLGLLLTECNKDAIQVVNRKDKNEYLSKLLRRYESLRKQRAELLVAGAIHTRHYYHLLDGVAQQKRDRELAGLSKTGWSGECSFNWGDAKFQKDLLSFSITI